MKLRDISIAVAVLVPLVLAACTNRPTPPPPGPEAVNQPVIPPAPSAPPVSFIQHGKASFYADIFHGRATATGAPFDQNALTAASKVLPLGARAEVTNLKTGKSVTVEVNDRGPHVPGRIIDLSKRAAILIGIDRGIARVKVEARVADQPTEELRDKVARIAAAKSARREKRLEMSSAG